MDRPAHRIAARAFEHRQRHPFADGGTTHQALIGHLPKTLKATVVTHSPTMAAALEFHESVEVILLGGTLYRHSMVALGAATQDGYAAIRADLCLLGVTGVHAQAGLTTGNHEEALIKRRMMASAAETAVLATPDKLATASPFQIAPLTGLATLVTIGAPPDWLPADTAQLAA